MRWKDGLKEKGKQIEDYTIEQNNLSLDHPSYFDSNSAATVQFVIDLYWSGITTGITQGTSGSSGSSGKDGDWSGSSGTSGSSGNGTSGTSSTGGTSGTGGSSGKSGRDGKDGVRG